MLRKLALGATANICVQGTVGVQPIMLIHGDSLQRPSRRQLPLQRNPERGTTRGERVQLPAHHQR